MKSGQKIWAGPSIPHHLDKIQKKSYFFRETVPKSLKVFCCFTCYYWHNIHSPDQLFWLVVDLNKDKIPKGRAPKKNIPFCRLPLQLDIPCMQTTVHYGPKPPSLEYSLKHPVEHIQIPKSINFSVLSFPSRQQSNNHIK